jgi:hypothetical protein
MEIGGTGGGLGFVDDKKNDDEHDMLDHLMQTQPQEKKVVTPMNIDRFQYKAEPIRSA